MFIKLTILIAIVSLLMSLNSLRKESSKSELKKAKHKLSKGRVIFQSKN
ncbi:MAG TPA: hypothetical protein VFD45_02295 [Patescibacteria group bacterium]|nr:hypothetical protein [Patescibacteria group bacterium]